MKPGEKNTAKPNPAKARTSPTKKNEEKEKSKALAAEEKLGDKTSKASPSTVSRNLIFADSCLKSPEKKNDGQTSKASSLTSSTDKVREIEKRLKTSGLEVEVIVKNSPVATKNIEKQLQNLRGTEKDLEVVPGIRKQKIHHRPPPVDDDGENIADSDVEEGPNANLEFKIGRVGSPTETSFFGGEESDEEEEGADEESDEELVEGDDEESEEEKGDHEVDLEEEDDEEHESGESEEEDDSDKDVTWNVGMVDKSEIQIKRERIEQKRKEALEALSREKSSFEKNISDSGQEMSAADKRKKESFLKRKKFLDVLFNMPDDRVKDFDFG